MPKEIIFEDPSITVGLAVTWFKDSPGVNLGVVQSVSIVEDPPRPNPITGYALVHKDGTIERHEDGTYIVFDSVFCEQLTRNGVNKLIRILRRARDQAFGADA